MTDWMRQLDATVETLQEASQRIGDTDHYYVYIIWKRYTDNPEPFYVGKGHWQRLIKHQMDSEADSNRHKTNIIKKHERLGIECGYSIFDFFEDEEAAYRAEAELIGLIGRQDIGQGPLANKTDGGDGTRGHLAPKRGDSFSARSVVADGKGFSCVLDAAEYLGITSGALMSRIKNGWEGYFYADEGQRPKTKKILERYKKPVFVDEVRYDSLSEASVHTGSDFGLIAKRIRHGWDGYYYEDEGQLPRRTVWGSRQDNVSVCVRGDHYRTVADAARATGETFSMVYKRCLSTNYPEYLRQDGRLEDKSSPPKVPQSVLVGTDQFESISKAAENFHLTNGGVIHRCSSEHYPDWQFADPDIQAAKAFTPEFSSKPVQVTVEGVIYESQSAAAEALGVDINTVKKRCRSPSFRHWVGEGIDKQQPKDNRPGMIAIEIEGTCYRSISDASKKIGLPRHTIKKRLASEDWLNYKER